MVGRRGRRVECRTIPGSDSMSDTVAALGPGDRAPSFSLRRTFEEDVALDDLLARGPVVVVFYVFDFGDV